MLIKVTKNFKEMKMLERKRWQIDNTFFTKKKLIKQSKYTNTLKFIFSKAKKKKSLIKWQ